MYCHKIYMEMLQIQAIDLHKDIDKMKKLTTERHQEVLDLIESLSESTSSDNASSEKKSLTLNRSAYPSIM